MQRFPAMRTWWSDRILAMRRNRRRTLFQGAFYLLAIGIIDYLTGYEINLTVVYVTPLIMLTVAGGWRIGLVAVPACALVTETADYLAGHRFDQAVYHLYSVISHSLSYLSFLFIITQLLLLYDQEREVAGRDPLTGLCNRRGFLDRAGELLHQTAGKRQPWNLHAWDVAGFRGLNARFGHEKADTLLADLAGALRERLPHTALLARLGADHFLALTPGDRHPDAAEAPLPLPRAPALDPPLALRTASASLPPGRRTADEVAKAVDALFDAAKTSPAVACPADTDARPR